MGEGRWLPRQGRPRSSASGTLAPQRGRVEGGSSRLWLHRPRLSRVPVVKGPVRRDPRGFSKPAFTLPGARPGLWSRVEGPFVFPCAGTLPSIPFSTELVFSAISRSSFCLGGIRPLFIIPAVKCFFPVCLLTWLMGLLFTILYYEIKPRSNCTKQRNGLGSRACQRSGPRLSRAERQPVAGAGSGAASRSPLQRRPS